MGSADLSVIVLAWNNLDLTRQCVQSLRANTDVDYELIVVDNGSSDGTAEFAEKSADIAVVNAENLGFAKGMNEGLARAGGASVAFVNNDTLFPELWASRLVETLTSNPMAGIVLPAVTKAGNPVSVRNAPGDSVVRLVPFAEFPSGVVYVMPRPLIESLGGWNTRYPIASAEDLDLAFTVWAHGYDILVDERVLVEHEAQASVRQIEDRKALYRRNLELFLDAWSDPADNSPRVADVDSEEFGRNLERAQTAVIWIERMLDARDEANALREELARLRSGSSASEGRRAWFRSRS